MSDGNQTVAEEAQQARKHAPAPDDVVSAMWLGNDSDKETIAERGGREVMGVKFQANKPLNISVRQNTPGEVLHKKLKSLELAGCFKLGPYDKKHGDPVGAKIFEPTKKDVKALVAKAKAEQARRRGSAF